MPGRRKRAKAASSVWKKRSAVKSPPNRPKTLRNWSDESMRQAIEAGEMGANRAARVLKDRISGRRH